MKNPMIFQVGSWLVLYVKSLQDFPQILDYVSWSGFRTLDRVCSTLYFVGNDVLGVGMLGVGMDYGGMWNE